MRSDRDLVRHVSDRHAARCCADEYGIAHAKNAAAGANAATGADLTAQIDPDWRIGGRTDGRDGPWLVRYARV